jgi:hypothetical protein
VAKSKDWNGFQWGMQPAWVAYHSAAAASCHGAVQVGASITSGACIQRDYHPTISDKAKQIFGWIELVVIKNNPLSIFEDDIYRKYVRLDPNDKKTLREYIIKLADVVGYKIKEKIGNSHCISDGWSCSGVH